MTRFLFRALADLQGSGVNEETERLFCIPPRYKAQLSLCSGESPFSRLAQSARSLPLKKQDYKTALREVEEAQRKAAKSHYVSEIATKVRREESKNVLHGLNQYSSRSTSDLVHILQLTDYALQLDENNDDAKHERQSATSQLSDLLLGNTAVSNSEHADLAARIALERLTIAEPWIRQDSRFVPIKSKLSTQAYPAFMARIEVDDATNCPADFDQELVKKSIVDGLGQFGKIDRGNWSLTFRVKSPSCTQTDVPKQSVQQVNSTYVAGHNQSANPVYTQLQQALSSAQIELTRAEINNQNNPNFGNGLVVGFARGKVNRLQRQLSATAPYIDQEILQQYQVEKFVALRSCHVESVLQVYAKPTEFQFATELTVKADGEDTRQGVSGVLPQDKSGLQNVQPILPRIGECNARIASEYLTQITKKTRELAAGFFASAAMDTQLEATRRLASSMYVFDLASGTQYEALKENQRPRIQNAALEEAPSKRALDFLNLPVPKQIIIENANSSDSAPIENALENAMNGVVEIETDSGTLGSGFFFTNTCMVLTNHHVIVGAETIVLRTSSKKLFTAQVLASDDLRDLALLSTNARSCNPLQLEEAEKPHVGQEIFAIGSPLGLSGTVTKGIVSATRTTASGIHYIQLDATINPGNSGGPLLSRSGKVLGINTFKLKGFEGLN